MPALRKTLLAAVAVIGAGASIIHAQVAPEPTSAPPDAVLPMEKQANISPAEMTSRAKATIEEINAGIKQINVLRAAAMKAKDVIKLNCINDKLRQISALLRIAESSQLELDVAVTSNNEAERYHRYSMVTLSGDKARVLLAEAQSCIGEEIDYIGPLDMNVDQPELPDDPTTEDPLDDIGDVVEPPGYASPFE